MADDRWIERMRSAIERQRLPRRYAARLFEELSYHYEDLVMENPSMEARKNLESRLGDPEALAALAERDLARRSFARRRPLAAYVLMPVLLVLGLTASWVLLVAGVGWAIDVASGGASFENEVTSPWQWAMMRTVNQTARFLPFVLAVWAIAETGRNNAQRGWAILGCLLIALLGTLWQAQLKVSPDGHGAWMLGFGWPPRLDSVLQAVAPLGVALWMLRPKRNDRIRREPAPAAAV